MSRDAVLACEHAVDGFALQGAEAFVAPELFEIGEKAAGRDGGGGDGAGSVHLFTFWGCDAN